MPAINDDTTILQAFQIALFALIDRASDELDPDELDALRQSVVLRIDRVADTALGEF